MPVPDHQIPKRLYDYFSEHYGIGKELKSNELSRNSRQVWVRVQLLNVEAVGFAGAVGYRISRKKTEVFAIWPKSPITTGDAESLAPTTTIIHRNTVENPGLHLYFDEPTTIAPNRAYLLMHLRAVERAEELRIKKRRH